MRLLIILLLGINIFSSLYSQSELYRSDSTYKYFEHKYSNDELQFQKIDTSTNFINFSFHKKSDKDNFNWIDFHNDKDEIKLSIMFWKNSKKIQLIAEFDDSKANGKLIWFDKNGKIEIIAEYKDERLVDIIYYRKKNPLINSFQYLDIIPH